MFTVRRLGLSDALERTLTTTNPAESMISIARTTQRNVKNWKDTSMARRWTAAGMLVAEVCESHRWRTSRWRNGQVGGGDPKSRLAG